MVTTDEIGQVPLFAALWAADRERLSRACADIRLAGGEYAVHEGDERALFAILAGRIEVVKLVDGIERGALKRHPSERIIDGQVPETTPLKRERESPRGRRTRSQGTKSSSEGPR